MPLFEKLLKRSRDDPKPDVVFIDKSDFPSVLFDHGYVTLNKHPDFVAGIDKVADLVSNMTIHLISKDENGHEKRVRNELAKKLDINPNRWMTRKTYINAIVRGLMSTGNQVVIPEYELGYLENLTVVPPNQVSFGSKDFGYAIRINGKDYDPENLLHFVLNPDPIYPYRGVGYRVILKDILENLSTASKTKKGYMSQKFSPSMIVSVEADGDSKEWKTKRQSLQEEYLTTSEAGAPWVIPSSMMDVKSVKPLTLQDLAINEAVEIDKRTVAAVLGIPAFLLGVGEFKRDEYNNFIETKVKSIATIIQQEKTKKLIYSDDMYIRFNHHSLLDYSLTDWATIGKNLRSIGVMTGNEVRNKVGLEFDDKPELNDYVMLENYLKVEDIDKQKKLEKGGD